jgi:hypothetical protein
VNIALLTALHALSSSDADVTFSGEVGVPFISMPVNEGVFEGNDILVTASKTIANDIAKFSSLLKALRASKANRPQRRQTKPKFKRCVLRKRQPKEESK